MTRRNPYGGPSDILIIYVLSVLTWITLGFAVAAFVSHLTDDQKWYAFHIKMAVGCGVAELVIVTLAAYLWDEPNAGPGGGE